MSELRTEARLLLQTVEDRLLELRSLVPAPGQTAAGEQTAPAAATAHDHPGHRGSASAADVAGRTAGAGSADGVGNGCPLCTLLAVLRGERPDLAAALIDGAMTVLALARSLVSDQPASDAAAADPHVTDPGASRPLTTDPPTDPISAPAAPQRRPPERIRIS